MVFSYVFQQWLTGSAVTMLTMMSGIMGGWSSPTMVKLTSPDSPISIDAEQISWVASLLGAGRFFGTIFGALLSSFIGSKRTILVTLLPIALGWLMLIFPAISVEWLYASRISEGLGQGMSFSVFPLFLAEVSLPEIRGALISLTTVGLLVGMVISSACSSYFDVADAATIYLCLTLILVLVFFWLPESPHHLVNIGNYEAAQKAIHWYRAGKDVDRELDAVDKFVTGNREKSFTQKLKLLKSPAVRKMTYQIITLFIFMHISGLNTILFYMEMVLINAKFTLLKPSLLVICNSACGIIASIISMFLIEKCGRKFLLIVSSAGISISMLALSGHFFMIIEVTYQWIPMASILLFITLAYAGMVPVPKTLLSETFPTEIKYLATILANVTGGIFGFLVPKMYQPMIDLLGQKYVFLVYAICASLVIPYTLLMIPETKGKTLQEIQDELTKNQ